MNAIIRVAQIGGFLLLLALGTLFVYRSFLPNEPRPLGCFLVSLLFFALAVTLPSPKARH